MNDNSEFVTAVSSAGRTQELLVGLEKEKSVTSAGVEGEEKPLGVPAMCCLGKTGSDHFYHSVQTLHLLKALNQGRFGS